MNIGIINGGSGKNSIPANCNATIEFRTISKKHVELIKEKIEKLSQKYKCSVKIVDEIDPFISESNLIEKMRTANFITEASFVDAKEKIILGVGPITAHEVNEYITKESYDKLVKQYINIIRKKDKE